MSKAIATMPVSGQSRALATFATQTWRWRKSACALAVALVVLSGCTLPRAGSLVGDMNRSAATGTVDLRPATVDLIHVVSADDVKSFPAAFIAGTEADYERLEPGDSVQVKIWERDGLALFNSGNDGAADLGDLQVNKDGFIQLPFVGNVRAEGLTEAQLRIAVVSRLKTLIIAPEVSVRSSQRAGKTVVAEGDLAKPGLYTIGPGMQRISALLAVAAPNAQDPEQVRVEVRRSDSQGSIRLSDIYADKAQDIALRPGDVVIVHSVAEMVTLLGAMRSPGRIKVTKRNFSVRDAIADARGLNDAAADPRAVYLLREADGRLPADGVWSPIIYQFDLTKPDQLVLAGQVTLRDGDAIYVSDASFTQATKLLSAFSLSVSTLRAGEGMAQ